jgi:hypothetical protein
MRSLVIATFQAEDVELKAWVASYLFYVDVELLGLAGGLGTRPGDEGEV